jgi:hypothetical protein
MTANGEPANKGMSAVGIAGIVIGVLAPLFGFIYGGVMYVANKQDEGKRVMLWSLIAFLLWFVLLFALTCGAAVDGASQAVIS